MGVAYTFSSSLTCNFSQLAKSAEAHLSQHLRESKGRENLSTHLLCSAELAESQILAREMLLH